MFDYICMIEFCMWHLITARRNSSKNYSWKKCENDNLTFVVFNRANPSIPDVKLSAPDFFAITSAACFSDPSLKPSIEKRAVTLN